MKGFAIRLNKN